MSFVVSTRGCYHLAAIVIVSITRTLSEIDIDRTCRVAETDRTRTMPIEKSRIYRCKSLYFLPLLLLLLLWTARCPITSLTINFISNGAIEYAIKKNTSGKLITFERVLRARIRIETFESKHFVICSRILLCVSDCRG